MGKDMKIYWNGESKNIIGNKVKELRKAQGISQKMLTARLQTEGFEFTDLTILRIEQGKRFVPDYKIVAIADYFHVSADYLLGIEKKNK
jgi:transcriptional regulator with XRE-family HTH domain